MNSPTKRMKLVLTGGVLAGAMGLGFSQPGTPQGSNTNTAPSTDKAMTTDEYKGAVATAAELPPNVASGWKIRVCSEKTKAEKIQFKFTTADKKSENKNKGQSDKEPASSATTGESSTGEMTAWSKGESTMIPVPSELRDSQRLRIEATPSTKDKDASICVLYNDHVAKALKFDNREVSTVKSTENGSCGC